MLKDVSHRSLPMITFGAKAIHFSNKADKFFTSITLKHFCSIPKRSNVFLSFGEIDCRPNEGLVAASHKLSRSIEDLVNSTVAGYVGWFSKQNKDKKHNLFF